MLLTSALHSQFVVSGIPSFDPLGSKVVCSTTSPNTPRPSWAMANTGTLSHPASCAHFKKNLSRCLWGKLC